MFRIQRWDDIDVMDESEPSGWGDSKEELTR